MRDLDLDAIEARSNAAVVSNLTVAWTVTCRRCSASFAVTVGSVAEAMPLVAEWEEAHTCQEKP